MSWWQNTLCRFGNAAYKLARVNRTNANWQPLNRHAEEAIRESFEMMQARTRDLAINTPMGKRIAEALTDMIVGGGIKSFAVPFGSEVLDQLDGSDGLLESRLLDDLSYSLESDDFFSDWAKHADADGDGSWWDIERLLCYELVNSGNALLLKCDVPDPSRQISLCYQVIERDQLDHDKDRPSGRGRNRILNGIEYDGRNRKVAYHIFDAHPSATAYLSTATSARIPSARVIHCYLRFRPSQRSGTPWTQESAQAIKDKDWYMGNELTSAALQAILTFIHKSPSHPNLGGLLDGTDDEDTYGNPLLKLGAGVVYQGGPDDELEVAESKRPSRDAAPFLQEMNVETAMGAGLSPSRLTRDYRSHSYTSARAAHLDDDAHLKPLQKWFADQISLPVRTAVNAQAAGMGLFTSKTPTEFRRDIKRLQRFEALGPGREQLDPEKETDAALAKLRGGLSTLRDENGRRQQHWVRVLLQRAIEQRVTTALGVELDLSKGQGGQPGENGEKKQMESEADDAETP